MTGYARAALITFGLVCTTSLSPVFAQAPAAAPKADERSSAYYAFAMAHLYGELASAYGNRGEYVNKAIDFYKQAMKLDPNSSYIGEELADLYLQTGQLERATQQANDLIKANPNSANAHKTLARIYARQIGDPDQGQAKVDQAMLKLAIGEYQKITDLDPKDVESLAMLARLYRVAQDPANAEKAYKALQLADPNSEEALTGLATVYADRGDIPGAIGILKEAADKNPEGRMLEMLAELYEQARQYSSAADTWQKLLPLTNDNAQVRKHYAANLLAAGRADEALKAFQDLSNDDPKNVELQLQIVELLGRKKDFTAAHAALEKARALSNSPDVRVAEAELLDAEGKSAQGITVLQGVLVETKKTQYKDDERGQRISMLETLARMQAGADKTPDAVATFRQIAELNPAAASRVEVQVIATMIAGKDFKGARQTADSALKKFPNDKAITVEHAIVLAELGQYDGAISDLRAMPNASQDREILLQVAQFQEKAKKYADEIKSLDAAEALSSSDPEKQDITFRRGAMYEREKNYDAAEQQFRKVLASDPNNSGALNYLGYMLADRNVRLEEAQQMISKALDIDPGNGAFLDSLGWVHFRLNKLDQAADELRQAIDKVGKDATVHDHLGEVYFKQGKIREAIQQWEASISELKSASPSEQDPEELSKVTKKLENARVRVAERK